MVYKSSNSGFIQTEFKNEQFNSFKNVFVNKSKPFGIILPYIKELSIEIKQIIYDKFGFNSQNIITGSRFSGPNNMLLHSKKYQLKKSSDSYTIAYIENNTIQFGEIIEFYQIQNEFYALVNIFKKKRSNLPLSLSFFYNIFKNKGLFERFYTSICTEDVTLDIILCKNISNKCIVVQNPAGKYITRVMYQYEHD